MARVQRQRKINFAWFDDLDAARVWRDAFASIPKLKTGYAPYQPPGHRKQKMREYRAARIERGLCVGCGCKLPCRRKFISCDECRDVARKKWKAKHAKDFTC